MDEHTKKEKSLPAVGRNGKGTSKSINFAKKKGICSSFFSFLFFFFNRFFFIYLSFLFPKLIA